MPRLNYVGTDPATPTDILNRGQGTVLINNAAIGRNVTSEMVESTATTLAAKSYIDLADANYVTVDYYQGRDALNVPTSSVGQPNGVASLSGGKIPTAQIPVLGAGYLRGPFGPTSITAVNNAATTPVKVADFTIGVQNVGFHALAYATVAVDSKPGGRPILEMRLSNGSAVYGSQTLIAQGVGRPMFDGRQIVAITPASDTTGASAPAHWPGSTNIVVSLWAYSTSSTPITVGSASVISAVVFLSRMVA